MAVGADRGTRTPTVSRQNLNLVRLPISPYPLLNRSAFFKNAPNSSQILNCPRKRASLYHPIFPVQRKKAAFPV
ncbi:hypothetical protein OHAE_1052 [Ochrobactrum soli]|uniref:Uncharacterized protein n=1 Tax=Ochrobactrum soli TaxID=2448455 RepID=A0A2P9HM55_9HYPH|nr:hypothetical protein OHAE_1052 [[Ochrobactrum] soli]